MTGNFQYARWTRGAAAALLLAGGPAAQAAIDVDVDITVPSLTIIQSPTSIGVNIPASVFGSFLVGSMTCTPSGSVFECEANPNNPTGLNATLNGSNLEADVNVNADDLTGLGTVNLVLLNAWRVWAIGPSGATTTVTVAQGSTTSLANGSASIAVSDVGVSLTGASTNKTVSFSPPGLGTPQRGNVTLQLDMTGATLSGTYSGTGTQVYTITASTA